MVKRSILFIVVLLLVTWGSVQAHTVTEVGDYAIIAAWENEPPVLGERNTIVIDIFNQNGEISLSDVALRQFELVYGETTRAAVPAQSSAETVRYKVSFIPTVEGEIGVHLVGTLGDEPLDVTVFPERVEPVRIIQFPDVMLSNADLQRGLISIEDQLAAQRQQILISYVIAGIGVLTGIVGVVRGRRN